MFNQDHYKLCFTALKLMHCYNSVSDEFGFNPREDKAKIVQAMQGLV